MGRWPRSSDCRAKCTNSCRATAVTVLAVVMAMSLGHYCPIRCNDPNWMKIFILIGKFGKFTKYNKKSYRAIGFDCCRLLCEEMQINVSRLFASKPAPLSGQLLRWNHREMSKVWEENQPPNEREFHPRAKPNAKPNLAL